MATPICTIDATGIHRPTLQECVDWIQAQYKGVFGQDVYIDPDSQDGQHLGIFAQAYHDGNGMAVSVYNSFSPSTAQGAGLDSVIKINGITRNEPTYSTAVVTIAGVVGTTITNGQVMDEQGYVWDLPASVVIPASGEIDVSAVCTTIGAIAAPIGTINIILTPTVGWQTVDNTTAAGQGAPVETDGQVRIRQAFSASLPAKGTLKALEAGIADNPQITRYRVYENNHPGDDPIYGIPGYSVAVVTEGGMPGAIANIIYAKKGTGVRTYGTTKITLEADDAGITHDVYYSPLVDVNISVFMQIVALQGFTQVIEDQIRQSVTDFINNRGIGMDIELADIYMAARLNGDAKSKTYSIVPGSLQIARDGLATAVQDVAIAYNETGYGDPSYVTIRLPIL